MWRPDNWKEIIDKLEQSKLAEPHQEIFQGYCEGLEDGADAMLKALKDKAEYLHNTGTMPYGYALGKSLKLGEKGWLVFIEDEE